MKDEMLSDEQRKVLKDKATEAPFSGALLKNKESGVYMCAACSAPLFDSETKFESGSGWPSFYDVITNKAIKLVLDNTHGMVRTEVVCATCNGHLGHIFPDGPQDKTGQRYCINSLALNFKPNDANKPMKYGDGRDINV